LIATYVVQQQEQKQHKENSQLLFHL